MCIIVSFIHNIIGYEFAFRADDNFQLENFERVLDILCINITHFLNNFFFNVTIYVHGKKSWLESKFCII